MENDDIFEFLKVYYQLGRREFPINRTNTIKGSGKVFYHFIKEGELDLEAVNPFLKRFKVEEEPIHNYSKDELNSIILQFEYTPFDSVINGDYSRQLFASLKCKSLIYKTKVNFTNNETNYFAIIAVNLKQKGNKTILDLLVHVYLDENIRDEKYTLSNNIFKNSFV